MTFLPGTDMPGYQRFAPTGLGGNSCIFIVSLFYTTFTVYHFPFPKKKHRSPVISQIAVKPHNR